MTRVQKKLGELLALVALMGVGLALAEPPTLDWYRVHFAPTFILAGEARDQGFGDVLLRTLVAKLPQYRHRLIDAPLERALERAGAENGLACTGVLLRTPERETRMYFSDPYFIMSPNGALIRASDRSCFEPFLDNGHLSLNRLLQTRKFALGINRNRSYGAGISPLLTRHIGQPYLIKKAGQGATPALLSDLSAQRGVDLVLAHPLEAAYWIKTSRSPIPLHFLPIVEALDNEQYQIACSRTPQGEQAITAINGLLADPEFRQDYLRAYANWQEQLAGQLPGAPLQASDPGLMR